MCLALVEGLEHTESEVSGAAILKDAAADLEGTRVAFLTVFFVNFKMFPALLRVLLCPWLFYAGCRVA